jgi:YidC/Oxa1 family membrane protein insertase
MTEKKKFSLMPYLLVLVGTFLVLQVFMPNPADTNPELEGDVVVETAKDKYAIGKDIKVNIYNNTDETLEIEAPRSVLDCEPAFITYQNKTQIINEVSSTSFVEITKPEETCDYETPWVVVQPGKKETISLLGQTYSNFGAASEYKVALVSGGIEYQSNEFDIVRPGLLTRVWRTAIYQPMLNALVAIVTYMPGHQLGLAVIVLTLIIRTLLLVPSQKGFEAQRKMQLVQPELEKLKEKYKDDQARLAQETMALWKKHQVHPFSSCLPMLIQLPVFLALFYVIQAGLSPDRSIFVYEALAGFDLSLVEPMFLTQNLLERNIIVLPILIGVLQFIQMQIMTSGKKPSKKPANEVETANKMMKYVMPLMIAFFTAQLPAAVGVYWGTNTIYGIIQQLVIKKLRPATLKTDSGKDDVKVRVINKNNGKGS